MPEAKDMAQAQLKDLPIKAGQRYRHFKGGEYEVIALGIKEDTLEPLVVYRSLLKSYVWARTAQNFMEAVERDGTTKKRFELLSQ